jgi:hypothetical protein
MSPTRKPKPPDKGAPPEHKPSRKVALEEVMRSLQDLVSNELAIEPAKPSGETETVPAKSKKSGSTEKPSAAPASIAPVALETSPPDTVASAMTAESGTGDQQPPTSPSASNLDGLEGLPDLAAVAPTIPVTTTNTDQPIPAGGLQQELPYLEDIAPATAASPAEPTPAQIAPQIPESLPEILPLAETSTAELPHIELKTEMMAGNSASIEVTPTSVTKSPPAATEEINWDDFPVLEEAVELAEMFDADAAGSHAETPQSAGLPRADAARRLAIQVAARLNVELRKSGQAGLSSDIIIRLARLLQEALAKGTANMENNTVMNGGSAGREAVPTGTNAGADSLPPPDKH